MKLPSDCEQTDAGFIACEVKGKKVFMKHCDWHLGINSTCTARDGQEYAFPDSIFPISLDRKSEEQTIGTVNYPAEKRTFIYGKPLYLVGKMGDLGEKGDKSVILNLFDKKIVRRIVVETGSILIDNDEPLRFPKNLDIYYEPWEMDRGSFVFKNPSGNIYHEGEMLKLATEADIMRVQPEI